MITFKQHANHLANTSHGPQPSPVLLPTAWMICSPSLKFLLKNISDIVWINLGQTEPQISLLSQENTSLIYKPYRHYSKEDFFHFRLNAAPHVHQGLLFHPSSHPHCHIWVTSGSFSYFCPISVEPLESISPLHSPCSLSGAWSWPRAGWLTQLSCVDAIIWACFFHDSFLASLTCLPLRVLPKKFLMSCLLRTSLLPLFFFPLEGWQEGSWNQTL